MPHVQNDQHSHENSVKRGRLEARVPLEQKSLFQKAADLQGKSLTEFLINSAQKEALKTIREYEVITLGKKDQRIFMDALLSYETPNEALRSAAIQYLETQQ